MAITYVENESNGFVNTNSATLTCADSVSPTTHGIIAIFNCYNPSLPSGLTVSDNVNTGNYTQSFTVADATDSLCEIAVYYMKCNATGTPTVTFSASAGLNAGITIIHVSGFVNGIAPVAADTASNFGSNATAPTVAGFTNSQANEFLLAILATGGGSTLSNPTPANWTIAGDSDEQQTAYWIESTSGNSISYGNTISPARGWLAAIVGFYDAAAAANTASIAWVS